MPQSHAAVYLHLIFSTKNRQPFLRDELLRTSAHECLAGASQTLDCPSICIGGVEGHVHVLARPGRSIAIKNWVKELKRTSTISLKERAPELAKFHWQAGYGVFSVSQSGLEKTVEYIGRQSEHHRRVTFQEELRAFFKKYKIAIDERYVWD